MNHNERNGETQVGNIEWRAHGCARGESAFIIGVKRLAGLYSFNLKEGVDQLIKIQRSIPSF